MKTDMPYTEQTIIRAGGKIFLLLSAVISTLAFSACSERIDAAQEQAAGEHIFQGQARAIKKAKGVEQTIQDAATQQRSLMDRQEQ